MQVLEQGDNFFVRMRNLDVTASSIIKSQFLNVAVQDISKDTISKRNTTHTKAASAKNHN